MAATQPAPATGILGTVAGGFPSHACQDSANPRGKPCGNLEVERAPDGAVREAREELGIDIDPDELQYSTLIHFVNDEGYGPAFALFFIARTWRGTPSICEPDKCDELRWCSFDELPEPTVPYVAEALNAVRAGLASGQLHDGFRTFGWTVDAAPETKSAEG